MSVRALLVGACSAWSSCCRLDPLYACCGGLYQVVSCRCCSPDCLTPTSPVCSRLRCSLGGARDLCVGYGGRVCGGTTCVHPLDAPPSTARTVWHLPASTRKHCSTRVLVHVVWPVCVSLGGGGEQLEAGQQGGRCVSVRAGVRVCGFCVCVCVCVCVCAGGGPPSTGPRDS